MRWKPARERFWNCVKKSSGCWEWTASCYGETGYGCFYDGKAYSAHRYSWVIHFGKIPSGKCVLHRCDNRRCIRPDHLWIGTKKQNSLDMAAKGRYKVPAYRGEQHGEAKLTNRAVWEIRASKETGLYLAEKFNVSPSLISLVKKRKAWTHL